jgi:hypothetical protein
MMQLAETGTILSRSQSMIGLRLGSFSFYPPVPDLS